MRFKVYGPYDIGVNEGLRGWIDKDDIKVFWEEVGDELQNACGVYLFGMYGEGKTGIAKKDMPWYVGKAERLNFKKECFNGKNTTTFNKILTKYKKKGKPFLYLLARVEENKENNKEEFSKLATANKPYRDVGLVEEMFIQLSLSINSDLENIKAATMAKKTSIRGLLNTTKYPSDSVDDFKSAFGIKDREPAKVVDYKDTKFRYGVYGPYPVPFKQAPKVVDKTIEPEHVKEMWDALRKGEKGKDATLLNEASGVYVIGMRNDGKQGGNTTPWYVGTAEKISFEERCFEFPAETSIVKRRGTPVIYFLPKLADKGDSKLAKPRQTLSTPGDMDYVTRVLLEYGVQVNKEGILLEPAALHLKILQSLSVEGFVNSPKGVGNKTEIKKLKQLLGLKE